MVPTIRPARLDDADDVESFTRDTWPERGGDYVPRVFESWVRENGPVGGDGGNARTLVAETGGRAVGLLRTVLLSPGEAWCGGLRVDPDHRGEGLGVDLVDAGFEWARDRGASVARAMVFGWNTPGLGAARAAGFEPVTEFRWAHPEPASGPGGGRVADPDAVWDYWRGSDAHGHLEGLALDEVEPWALSTLTRERLVEAAEDGRLLAVGEDGVRGFAVRVRVAEYPADGEGEGPDRWAEYAVADWAGPEAAAALFDRIAADAAAVDADRTRVLIPESVRAVSDVALARVEVADAPDFVMGADLAE